MTTSPWCLEGCCNCPTVIQARDFMLDPLQFAYKPHRGVEDATCLNLLLKHLERERCPARPIDWCSAFNSSSACFKSQELTQL